MTLEELRAPRLERLDSAPVSLPEEVGEHGLVGFERAVGRLYGHSSSRGGLLSSFEPLKKWNGSGSVEL